MPRPRVYSFIFGDLILITLNLFSVTSTFRKSMRCITIIWLIIIIIYYCLADPVAIQVRLCEPGSCLRASLSLRRRPPGNRSSDSQV
jgi:hypothetical protein